MESHDINLDEFPHITQYIKAELQKSESYGTISHNIDDPNYNVHLNIVKIKSNFEPCDFVQDLKKMQNCFTNLQLIFWMEKFLNIHFFSKLIYSKLNCNIYLIIKEKFMRSNIYI